MSKIEQIKYSEEMIEAIEQLDRCDFSVILEKFMPFISHVDDIKQILDKYVDDERIQLAFEWFSEDDWIIYLESRYNLKFHERVEYICYNPEEGITKNKI